MSVNVQCHPSTAKLSIDVPTRANEAVSGQLRPSEYTTLLIQALRADPDAVAGTCALEIGFGSGVVLAALGSLGAAHLCGVDIEPLAAAAAAHLLAGLGYAAICELFEGNMWLPVAGRRFDLIVANLPHFPTENGPVGDRLPTWSCGGPDGREFLDEFIRGLAEHLRPGGRALVTHNAFVGIDCSRELAARYAFDLRVVLPSLVYIPTEKLRTMTDSVRQAQQGRTIHAYGPCSFGEMSIVEFRRPESVELRRAESHA
jgi:release factor glutamine methyltransferase